MKTCDDSKWIGDICRALGGQLVDLDYGQRQMVNSIKLDSGWMDERIEEQRERWRDRQRKHRSDKARDIGDIRDNGDMSQCHTCHDTSVPPSVPPSIRPSNTSISRSVTVRARGNGNGNGTVDSSTVRLVDDFKTALAQDSTGGSVFFDPTFDAVIMAVAVTGDGASARRWRQACQRVGEDVFRQELFSFYREIRAGEDCNNRGATLNARLKRLEAK